MEGERADPGREEKLLHFLHRNCAARKFNGSLSVQNECNRECLYIGILYGTAYLKTFHAETVGIAGTDQKLPPAAVRTVDDFRLDKQFLRSAASSIVS